MPSAGVPAATATQTASSRAEEFYGTLNATQKKLLAEAIAEQPLQAEDWIAAREQRQRDQVQALRRAQQEADPARRAAALREVLLRGLQPADERQARWQAQGCELSAKLHNSTTPRQRQHLRDRLGAWEEDMRALAAAGAG
jgi:hypothetical protein